MMEFLNAWVPVSWPCGSWGVENQEATTELKSEAKRIYRRWLDPSTLELVRGTPINCLVVPWSSGSPLDDDNHRSLSPLLEAGRARKLSFVGIVKESADRESAMVSAAKAGLAALAFERWSGEKFSLPVIPWTERNKLPWLTPFPVFALTKTVWPGIKGDWSSIHDTANAGPTGSPWVNSNGWLIRLGQSLGPNKSFWVVANPPEQLGGQPSEAYVLAVADAAVYGARWVISLDYSLQSALLDGRAQAMEVWRRIISAVRFFHDRSLWSQHRPCGILGIVSDFSGENEFVSEEILNLTARRQLAFRILEKSQCQIANLEGLKAILYVDQSPPERRLREQLLDFAARGGTLVTSPVWGKPHESPEEETLEGRYSLYRYEKGLLALAKQAREDPYQLAEEVHLLLSRRNDLIRVWNGPALGVYLTESTERHDKLVQLVDYSGWGQSDAVSLWLKSGRTAGRFWTLSRSDPLPLRGESMRDGVEFHLPRFPVYAALEL